MSRILTIHHVKHVFSISWQCLRFTHLGVPLRVGSYRIWGHLEWDRRWPGHWYQERSLVSPIRAQNLYDNLPERTKRLRKNTQTWWPPTWQSGEQMNAVITRSCGDFFFPWTKSSARKEMEWLRSRSIRRGRSLWARVYQNMKEVYEGRRREVLDWR
jgi:hypothetical protein